LIGVTGNYGFFNLIALALCLLLVADEVSIGDRVVRVGPRRAGFALLAGTFCVLQGLQLSRALFRGEISEISASVLSTVAPFRTVNSYGLFAVMTTKRNEILLEGSDDGVTWKAYEFDHKPGDLSRRPQFVEPHMPRLDWQMWFAALGRPRQSPWLGVVMNRLLEGGREVTDLLETDPFPDAPPKYIRAEFYEYHFTDFEERDRTGNWWKRTRVGTYLPARSL
jgi:hypothetical protein